MKQTRKSSQEWLALINECQASGQSVSVWCEQHSIPRKSYSNAVSRLGRAGLIERGRKHPAAQPHQDIVGLPFGDASIGSAFFQPSIVLKTSACSIGISEHASQDIIRSTLAALQQLC